MGKVTEVMKINESSYTFYCMTASENTVDIFRITGIRLKFKQ
jgi:hypothetical protein